MNGDAPPPTPPPSERKGSPARGPAGLPTFLTNPIALLRLFVPFILVLGILDAIPHPDMSGSAMLDLVVSRLFRVGAVVSILVLTLVLLNRPAAEQRGPAPGLTDTIVSAVTGMADNLGWIVGALGAASTLLVIPLTDPFDGFLDWTEDFAFELALAVTFTALVAALVGLVRARAGRHDDSNILRPSSTAESAALLRDANLVVVALVLLAILLDILDEIDDVFDGLDGFADTFETATWYVLVLLAMEAVLLGFAWAIERRSGKDDPAALTLVARNVPTTVRMFWDGPAFSTTARRVFLVAAILYPILNFISWGGLDGDAPGGRDWLFHATILAEDLQGIAMFGGVLWAVTAGIRLLAGGADELPDVTTQALYAIGALSSIAAILRFMYTGAGIGFYNAFFGELLYYWTVGAGAIAGIVALRALYWDRTRPMS